MNLAGKKKQIVDAGSFYQVDRVGTVLTYLESQELATFVDDSAFEDVEGVKYFFAPNNDKLRVVLGKNWDYSEKDKNNQDLGYSTLDIAWPSPILFYGSPIGMQECGPPEVVTSATGFFGATQTVIKQKIVLKSTVYFNSNEVPQGTTDSNVLESWMSFVKRGIETPALNYNPIITAQSNQNPAQFHFDHYHLSSFHISS